MNNLLQILASSADGVRDLEGDINSFSIRTIGVAILILAVLLVIASRVVGDNKHKKLKKPMFFAIALTIILPSLLLIGSTIFINTTSESKGPVHWHTDIEYWVCGQEIELRDPYEFLSNKIGTSTYHEHDDKRIHLEGVVSEKHYDASLEKFMNVTGGYITSSELTIPTNNDNMYEDDLDGDTVNDNGDKSAIEDMRQLDEEGRAVLTMKNGDSCGSTAGNDTEVQVFLIRYDKDDDTYSQTKLAEPERYTLRDESVVPPGDCVIVEFDAAKSRTEKLCQQYGVRDETRCTEFGVSTFNPELCNAREKINNTSRSGDDS